MLVKKVSPHCLEIPKAGDLVLSHACCCAFDKREGGRKRKREEGKETGRQTVGDCVPDSL